MGARGVMVGVATCAAVGQSACAGVSFQSMGFLGSSGVTAAYDVSADGAWAVGESTGTRGFLWSSGTGMVRLGSGPGNSNPASGVLAMGVSAGGLAVAGSWQPSATGSPFPFRWTFAGGMENLGDLPGGQTFGRASDISADGSVVVGYSHSDLGPEAFAWSRETGMRGLGRLPGHNYSLAAAVSGDGSRIVGFTAFTSTTVTDATPCTWDSTGTLVALAEPGSPGEFACFAKGVSGSGQYITGDRQRGGLPTEAMRWNPDGTYVMLGALATGGTGSGGYGVSDEGWVVGTSWTADGNRAFLWRPSLGMLPLADVLVQEYGLDLTGWTLANASAITPDGTVIVGSGRDPQGRLAAWVAVVPAPGTIGALLVGALMGRHRRT